MADDKNKPYRLIKEWSDELGGYYYVLYKREIDSEALIRHWQAGYEPLEGPYRYKKLGTGDFEWAKRITQHYGTSIDSIITTEGGKHGYC